MPITIRSAVPADLPAITAIYQESVINGVGSYELEAPDLGEMTRRFESVTAEGYPYLVAEDGEGAILGYAYASAFRTRPAYRWLCEDSVYVGPLARGRRVGRALLDRLIVEATASGYRQMVAVIGGASPASIAVHKAAGFAHSGIMNATGFKHGRWLDTVIMQLALGEGAETLPVRPPVRS